MATKLILGIEEAGRGPIVGPMLIAGAMFYEDQKEKLREIGVKDSKLLKPIQREELFEQIEKLSKKYKLIEVHPQEIEQKLAMGINLNKLEALKFASIIEELKPDKAIIDCPSPNTQGFRNYILQFVTHKCEVICEHKADLNHPEVSAASILAKVTRDRCIKKIEEELNMEIGVGYPHDEKTRAFVRIALSRPEWIRKYVRRTWATFTDITEEKEQKKLGEY